MFAVYLVLGAIALESLSSYVMFRYFAFLRKDLHPKGSATQMLLDGSFNKARGKHPVATLSIDHGPLFDTSDTLGFIMRPGRYRITEGLDGEFHRFDLTVTNQGTRATAHVPVRSSKRIFMAGDSWMFGWGLDDEETLPWLMQTRLPDYAVHNLSLTSYSMVQALLQLTSMSPAVGREDIAVIIYDALTDKLNVAPADVLEALTKGYEMELGDRARMQQMMLPFGALDAQGRLSIRRVRLQCANGPAARRCDHPDVATATTVEITKRVFDDIMALGVGRLVIAFVSGDDNDAVVEYLRGRGALIADLRHAAVDHDLVPTEGHLGPFATHQVYSRLCEVLQENHVIDNL